MFVPDYSMLHTLVSPVAKYMPGRKHKKIIKLGFKDVINLAYNKNNINSKLAHHVEKMELPSCDFPYQV